MWSESLKSIASKCHKNYNIPIFPHLHFFYDWNITLMETFFYIGVVKRPFSQKMQNMTGILYYSNFFVRERTG
jgi:hypothetical protein